MNTYVHAYMRMETYICIYIYYICTYYIRVPSSRYNCSNADFQEGSSFTNAKPKLIVSQQVDSFMSISFPQYQLQVPVGSCGSSYALCAVYV